MVYDGIFWKFSNNIVEPTSVQGPGQQALHHDSPFAFWSCFLFFEPLLTLMQPHWPCFQTPKACLSLRHFLFFFFFAAHKSCSPNFLRSYLNVTFQGMSSLTALFNTATRHLSFSPTATHTTSLSLFPGFILLHSIEVLLTYYIFYFHFLIIWFCLIEFLLIQWHF